MTSRQQQLLQQQLQEQAQEQQQQRVMEMRQRGEACCGI
jgi:hypothetical protein